MRFFYEGELLTAVTHVNEGVMEYAYDTNGYLNQIIDQNGKKFLRNEYDREGRIKKQYIRMMQRRSSSD